MNNHISEHRFHH